MTRHTILILLIFISFRGITQNENEFKMITPTVLISGTTYQFEIPKATNSVKYFVIADGKKVECTESTCSITPYQSNRMIYPIEIYKVQHNDTSLYCSQLFEIMIMPDPLLNLGEFETEFFITVHKDSLSKIREISFTPSWNTNQIVTWRRIKVSVFVKGNEKSYSFEGTTLSDEILNDLAKLQTPTEVSFNISLSGSDYVGRVVKYQRIIHSLTDDEYFRRNNPFYDLHLNKRVEFIGPGTFDKNDTLKIKNFGDLYFHCIALGTENRYTFESIDNGEVISIDVMSNGPKELLDFRKKSGSYKVTLSGDGGHGELILIIE